MQDIRYIVLHGTGPALKAGLPLFEQDGVGEHVAHYRQLLAEGKLDMGGPHLDATAGGMMIPAAGVGEDEITAFARADPAVVSGLLTVAVRPWMVGMRKD